MLFYPPAITTINIGGPAGCLIIRVFSVFRGKFLEGENQNKSINQLYIFLIPVQIVSIKEVSLELLLGELSLFRFGLPSISCAVFSFAASRPTFLVESKSPEIISE